MAKDQAGPLVRARTYPDADRELPAREVTGRLLSRWVPSLGYRQYWVGRVQVDPETIEEVRDEDQGAGE